MLASAETGVLLSWAHYRIKPGVKCKCDQGRQAKKVLLVILCLQRKKTVTGHALHLNRKASRRLHSFVHRERVWAKIRDKLRGDKMLNVSIIQVISSEGQIISSRWKDFIYSTVSIFCMRKPWLKAALLRDSINASTDCWLFFSWSCNYCFCISCFAFKSSDHMC